LRTEATEQLTLADRLSRLSYAQACRILGLQDLRSREAETE
jgi:hypothetical protein